jgi:hypothetical protein
MVDHSTTQTTVEDATIIPDVLLNLPFLQEVKMITNAL